MTEHIPARAQYRVYETDNLSLLDQELRNANSDSTDRLWRPILLSQVVVGGTVQTTVILEHIEEYRQP